MTKEHRQFLDDMDKLIYKNRALINSFDSRNTVQDTERGANLINKINIVASIVEDMIHWEEVQS